MRCPEAEQLDLLLGPWWNATTLMTRSLHKKTLMKKKLRKARCALSNHFHDNLQDGVVTLTTEKPEAEKSANKTDNLRK